MNFFDIIWIFFIISFFMPIFKKKLLEGARFKLIQILEKKRNARVITLIHRQEALSFLGIPFSRYIDIEDSENILQAIRMTPKEKPIDLILHTPGGLVLASEQIALALNSHPAKVTVLVPHYAMSGGTLIAMAADEIIMDDHAVLGPIDPQIGEYPAASIIKAISQKDKNKIDDKTLILADVAQKASKQVYDFVYKILFENFGKEKSDSIAKTMTEGRWTHDYPITCSEAKELGLQVVSGLPEEVYELMRLYPQAVQRRPSVSYIPLPYPKPPQKQPREKPHK